MNKACIKYEDNIYDEVNIHVYVMEGKYINHLKTVFFLNLVYFLHSFYIAPIHQMGGKVLVYYVTKYYIIFLYLTIN